VRSLASTATGAKRQRAASSPRSPCRRACGSG